MISAAALRAWVLFGLQQQQDVARHRHRAGLPDRPDLGALSLSSTPTGPGGRAPRLRSRANAGSGSSPIGESRVSITFYASPRCFTGGELRVYDTWVNTGVLR